MTLVKVNECSRSNGMDFVVWKFLIWLLIWFDLILIWFVGVDNRGCHLINQQPTNNQQPTTNNQPTTNQQPTNNQPTTNQQPTNNQPTNNQPTTNQPTTNQQPTTKNREGEKEMCLFPSFGPDVLVAPTLRAKHLADYFKAILLLQFVPWTSSLGFGLVGFGLVGLGFGFDRSNDKHQLKTTQKMIGVGEFVSTDIFSALTDFLSVLLGYMAVRQVEFYSPRSVLCYTFLDGLYGWLGLGLGLGLVLGLGLGLNQIQLMVGFRFLYSMIYASIIISNMNSFASNNPFAFYLVCFIKM